MQLKLFGDKDTEAVVENSFSRFIFNDYVTVIDFSVPGLFQHDKVLVLFDCFRRYILHMCIVQNENVRHYQGTDECWTPFIML